MLLILALINAFLKFHLERIDHNLEDSSKIRFVKMEDGHNPFISRSVVKMVP